MGKSKDETKKVTTTPENTNPETPKAGAAPKEAKKAEKLKEVVVTNSTVRKLLNIPDEDTVELVEELPGGVEVKIRHNGNEYVVGKGEVI